MCFSARVHCRTKVVCCEKKLQWPKFHKKCTLRLRIQGDPGIIIFETFQAYPFLPQECEHKVLGSIHHILKDVGDVTLDMPINELLPVDEMDPRVQGMALDLSEAFYDTMDDDRGLPETGVRVLNIYTMENGESSVYRRCNAALHVAHHPVYIE